MSIKSGSYFGILNIVSIVICKTFISVEINKPSTQYMTDKLRKWGSRKWLNNDDDNNSNDNNCNTSNSCNSNKQQYKNNIPILKKGTVTWSAVPIFLSVFKWATSNWH